MTYEIDKVLVLSTGHLTQETMMWVDSAWYANENGAFLYVSPNADLFLKDEPEDLKAPKELARRLDCRWIKFDRDGPQLDDLPFYEW